MKKTILLLLLFITAAGSLSAQINLRSAITGTAIANDKPLADASVFLHKVQDSTMVKTEVTDNSGKFILTDIPHGKYYLKITGNDNYQYSGEAFALTSNLDAGFLTLEEHNNLEELTITKTKSFIERQQGKIVLNIQQSIASTGSTAFEILEKAPGISIDNNDNISLRGRSGIAVHIDGRPTPMTGANLANYLKGIPSGSIEKIELITNPSAKYDAAGSSIINIIMKKDKNMGTNGSVSVSYGQGIYPKANSSLSLNHRTKKLNAYANYSNAYRENFNDLVLTRKFYDGNDFTGAYEQDNYGYNTLKSHNIRAGLDYFAGTNHTLGLVITGNTTNVKPENTNVSKVYDENNTYTSRFETAGNTNDDRNNYSVNLNYRYVLDTINSTLISDFDYANYGSESTQNFTTRYFDTGITETNNPYILFGDIIGDLDIYAAKSDLKTTLPNKMGLEAGIKSSYVVADNDQSFFNRSNGVNMPDLGKSNHFIYKENINAAYASTSGEFGKWNFQLGLRVENTNILGKQLANHSTFNNSYTQLFPNIFAGYAISENHGLNVSYSRRINRPGYDQLNPFQFYLDPTTYRVGNPFLDPQTTHAMEVTYGYNKKYFATLSYSRTTDNITNVIVPSDENLQLTAQTFRNLNTVDYYGLELILPLQVTKWWVSTNNINAYYSAYSGTVGSTNINNKGNFTANFNTVNNFTISESFTAEFSGNYRAREVYAFMKVEPILTLNAGLQKKFSNNSNLRLAVNDMFFTAKTTADIEYTGYKEHFVVSRDTRTVVLSYTYNFGNNGAAVRRRAGASDDIKQRAGNA